MPLPHFSPLILLSTILVALFILFFIIFDSSSEVGRDNGDNRQLQRTHKDFLKRNDRSFKINSANNAHFGGNPTNSIITKSAEVVRPFQYKVLKNPVPVETHLGPFVEPISKVVDKKAVREWYNITLFNATDEVAQKRGKVYYSIFAGRRHFMKIHLRYTQILLNMSLIDEVHIWDICLDDYDNREFLYRFVNATNDPRYIIFVNPPEMVWRDATKMGQGYLWEAYYNHYATHDRYKDEDILFKADDDTVFLDVSSFDSFLSQITTPNLYFPNIVNNDAGLYVQAILNVHPAISNILYQYESREIPVEKLVNNYYVEDVVAAHVMSFGAVLPLTYWNGGFYTRGDYADQIHKVFLSNPQKFIHNCKNTTHQHHHHNHTKRFRSNNTATPDSTTFPQNASSSVNITRLFPVKSRISINMFAGKMAIIRQMYSIFLHHQCCSDEGFVGKWPSLTHLDHIIDTHFVVAHFAFNPQYPTSQYFGEWVVKYDDLSRKQYIAHFAEDIFDEERFRFTFPSNATMQEFVEVKKELGTKSELHAKMEEQAKKEEQLKKEEQARKTNLKNLIASYGKRFVWKESLQSKSN